MDILKSENVDYKGFKYIILDLCSMCQFTQD